MEVVEGVVVLPGPFVDNDFGMDK